MYSTPLHNLRARLEALSELIDREDDGYLTVLALADDPVAVEELARLFEAVDRQITGKTTPLHQYLPQVRRLLGGEVWHWHLADGGYSRITVFLVDGPRNVLSFDVGLSTDRAFAAWDGANGGRIGVAIR